jgi:hypothetical protein
VRTSTVPSSRPRAVGLNIDRYYSHLAAAAAAAAAAAIESVSAIGVTNCSLVEFHADLDA